MKYIEFKSNINEYFLLYEKGLKKQANVYMKSYIQQFRKINNEDDNNILYEFCNEICECENTHWMLLRGNGDLPFELHNCVRDYLYGECEKNEMPQLRWFYQLFRNDRIGCEDARKFLEKAYYHVKCDEKTVEIYFNTWIELLWWGSHHFPDGCIIEKSTYQNAFIQCEKISQDKKISEIQINDLLYYRKLYNAFERYI